MTSWRLLGAAVVGTGIGLLGSYWLKPAPIVQPKPVAIPSIPSVQPTPKVSTTQTPKKLPKSTPPKPTLSAHPLPPRPGGGPYGRDQGIPILMFHSILPNPKSKNSIAPGEFRRVLLALKDQGFCPVSLGEYLHNRFSPGCAGKKLFTLTFDDGHYSQVWFEDNRLSPNSAVGILLKVFAKPKATFFLNTQNGGLPFGLRSQQTVTWLRKRGFIIANHTASHSNLERKTSKQIALEVSKVCQHFGMERMLFAYPYGQERLPHPINHYSSCTIPAAFGAHLGYFEGVGQPVRPLLAPLPGSPEFEKLRYRLPRINIHSLQDLRRDVLDNPGVYRIGQK